MLYWLRLSKHLLKYLELHSTELIDVIFGQAACTNSLCLWPPELSQLHCVWFTTNSAALFLKQMGNSRGKTALTPIEKQSLFQQSVHKVFANISLLKSTVKPSLSVTHHTCALSCWNLKYCKKTCGIHSALWWWNLERAAQRLIGAECWLLDCQAVCVPGFLQSVLSLLGNDGVSRAEKWPLC